MVLRGGGLLEVITSWFNILHYRDCRVSSLILHMRTQGEIGSLQPRRGPSSDYAGILILDSRTVRNKCLLFKPPQFSSVAQSCPTLCNPMNSRTPGLPVHHQLPEFTQTHVHRVGDAIQPSHSLSSFSPLTFNLSQYQGLFQWISSSHQVAPELEFQLQHQSFQWIFRTDLR